MSSHIELETEAAPSASGELTLHGVTRPIEPMSPA